ncbi:MAG TPA: hypothetical protein VHG72_09010 [Polyangia bacterium]|nr:hypothetical protein [Polyangia bacterium]
MPILAAGLSTSGCSWIFVEPLPADDPSDYAHCTTSRAAPVIDTIFTSTNLLSALYVAGEDNVKNKGPAISLGLGVAALWLASAIYGYSKTNECEAARVEGANEPLYRHHHRGYVPGPPVYYPPPPGPPPAPSQAPDDDGPGAVPQTAPPAAGPQPPPEPASRPDAPRFGG